MGTSAHNAAKRGGGGVKISLGDREIEILKTNSFEQFREAAKIFEVYLDYLDIPDYF